MGKIQVNYGERYGKLTIIKEVEPYIQPNGEPRRKFQCKCDCGKTTNVILKDLRNGKTTSCGCNRGIHFINLNYKHGYAKRSNTHYLYKTWRNIKERCCNPKSKQYKDYGGRGIIVCDRWKYSFDNFLTDMGDRPLGHSIDRINVDGNYEPSNCRWATIKEQNNNKRKTKTKNDGSNN